MFEFNHLDLWNFQASVIDFIIIVFLFVSLRVLKGLVANVRTGDEIAQKDNVAFGVSFAGGIGALAIMLTGASMGEYGESLLNEGLSMLVFGLIGMALITLGRIVQDKIVFRKVALLDQIKQGNLAAAFVDVGNVLAIGIVIRAAMDWVETEGWMAIPIIIAAFVVSQLVLVGASVYRVRLFRARATENDPCMQKAFAQGNTALAVRYGGFLIGTALAITAASGVVPYNADNILMSVIGWAIVALVFSVIFTVVVALARIAILPGINVAEEVDRQGNASVAAIEAAIAIAIGLTLAALFA